MVLKKEKEYINGPVPLDDSWWDAILEDVETSFAAQVKTLQAPATEDEEKPAEDQEIEWPWVKNIYAKDQVIQLEVTDHNRGGLLVAGQRIRGFVPASHLVNFSQKSNQMARETILEPYVGQSLQLKIIECEEEQGRIVLSERAALAMPGKRHELFSELAEGDCLTGKVTTITDFGVFVDLGGVEGLIHISELSWGRVYHPSKVVAPGDDIKVCILQIDRQRNRIALSVKRLKANPWDSIEQSYQVGQVTNAVVTSIVSYGVFAQIEEGLDGLIHISAFSDQNNGTELHKKFHEGQEIKVCILNIDPERQRLGLSFYNNGNGAS